MTPGPADPYDLERFLAAQGGGKYERALAELRQGHKTSHWMWFVFPQIAGLGRSEMSVRYALSGIEEARAYWDHPVLGPRYDDCAETLLELGQVSLSDVLGEVDAQKLHSSLTLFAAAAPTSASIDQLLMTHFDGELDAATTRILGAG